MTENVQIDETAGTDVNDALVTEYTSESDTAVGGEAAAQRPRATAPGAATGRRKQAVARVRIVPGTGEWTINGRTLSGYFPNKVHQQIVNEPLTLLELDGSYDVLVRVHGGGPSGQAGARAPRRRPLAQRHRRGAQPPGAEEGRLPLPRRSRPRAQEGRSEEGPQGSPVQQALIRRRGTTTVVDAVPAPKAAPSPGRRLRCARE